MKMLTIICRERLQDEVLMFLEGEGIPGYTIIRGAAGGGVTGKVSGLHGASDRNHVFLIVLDESIADEVLKAVKHLHATLVHHNQREKVAFRAFVQSCDTVV